MNKYCDSMNYGASIAGLAFAFPHIYVTATWWPGYLTHQQTCCWWHNQGYVGFTYGLSRAGGAQSCCFKSESVDA